MKKLAILVLLFASLQASSQPSVTINVESTDISAGDTLLLDHMSLFYYDKTVKTTLFVADEDGKATICDAADSFSRLRLNIGKNNLTLYADAGQTINIKVTNPADMEYVTPTGGFYDDPNYYDYISKHNTFICNKNKALDKFDHFARIGVNDSAQHYFSIYNSISSREDSKRELEFMKRTDNQVSVYMYAHEWGMDDVEKKNFEKQWKKMDEEIKASGAGEYFKQTMETRKGLRHKAKASDFTVIDTRGNKVDLKSLEGRFVILYYWGVCGYVLQSCSDLVDLHEKYGDILTTIALTEESTFNSVSNYNEHNTEPVLLPLKGLIRDDWTNVLTSRQDNEQIKEDYLMMATPCVVLISPKGRIIKHGYANVLRVAKNRLKLYTLFHRK